MSILMKILGGGRAAREQALAQCRECLGEFEDAQCFAENALNLFRSAVESFASRMAWVAGDRAENFQEQFANLRRRIRPMLPRQAMEEIRGEMDRILGEHAEALISALETRDREIRESAAALAVLAEAVAAHDKPYRVRFESLARKMRGRAGQADLADLHRMLAAEVEKFERYAGDAGRDTRAAAERLRT